MAQQLVSTTWLRDHLGDADIVLLDASPDFNIGTTIKGAQHFDIKNIFSDTESPFPNTFPTVTHFQKASRELGVNNESHIIIFDSKGIFTSPRVWWMFKTMGHSKVNVLDGGLPAWQSLGLPLGAADNRTSLTGNFKAIFNKEAIASYTQVIENLMSNRCQIIDARSEGRFKGTTPEPRVHLNSGNIKHSKNLPYTEVIVNGHYKSREELTTIFETLVRKNQPLIFSCGSGITACIILLAYRLISDQPAAVFDGSWTEWAEREGLFINHK